MSVFLRSGDAKHIAHINQIGIFQSVKPHKRRHRCAKSLGNLPERIAPADGIGFIRSRLYHAYTQFLPHINQVWIFRSLIATMLVTVVPNCRAMEVSVSPRRTV